MRIAHFGQIFIFCFLTGMWPCAASAVVIEIAKSSDDLLQAVLSEIEQLDDRVYTLDLQQGEINFGDGIAGARPPSGRSGVIGSYNYGGGEEGSISNEFDLLSVEFPLAIPLSELLDSQSTDTSINIVLVGISALEFDLTPEKLIITAAHFYAIPAPATLVLMSIGLAGMVFSRRKN